MTNLILTSSDKSLIEFLRTQGVITSTQAYKYFYSHLRFPHKRINALAKANIIQIDSIKHIFRSHGQKNQVSPTYFPYIIDLDLNENTRVLMLSRLYRANKQMTGKLLKRNLILHQLILNEVRIELEKDLNFNFLLNDPKLIELSGIRIERKKEFVPDLSFESNQYKIAIELERTCKSRQRYIERFLHLRKSPYSHMIYYYTNESTKKFILNKAQLSRKIGLSHFRNHTEVLSPVWGYMSLKEYIEDAMKYAKRK